MVDLPSRITKLVSIWQTHINGGREIDLSRRSGSGSRPQTAGGERGMRLLSL
jgi:hypothetical protein